ncbi:MAG: transglutaminase domain-containing protein [Planctomycetes bacterium]|nr:transglutaminase domain-containing protein [Planctomycetota bacterium]
MRNKCLPAAAKHDKRKLVFVALLLSLMLIFPSCKKEKEASITRPLSPEPATLEYYKGHSAITNPGKYAGLYDTLPETIPELCHVVQGLLLHEFHTNRYGVNLPEQRKKESRLREVENILQRAMELADKPLIEPREPENRVISNCRDYAVLMCSFLRGKEIPARVRVGFAIYFDPYLHQGHWICEYWDKEKSKWVQVDAQLDDIQKRYYEVDFDTLNVPADKFLYAGEEFRIEDKKSDDFNFVKRTLIQDLAALNKIEAELWDTASFMDVDEHQNSETSNLLRRIVEITTSRNDRLSEVRAIYENHGELQISIN